MERREKKKKTVFIKSKDIEEKDEKDEKEHSNNSNGEDDISYLLDPKIIAARDKLNELSKRTELNLRAESKSIGLFQNTNDPEIVALLEEAKVNLLSFQDLKSQILTEKCRTTEGNLARYDPPENHFDLNLFFLVLGKRRTGKTYFADDFLGNYLHIFKNFCVLTNTKFNGFWQKRIPSKFIKDSYDPRYVAALFQIQKEKKLEMRKKHPEMSDDDINKDKSYQLVVILDDILREKNTMRFDEQLIYLAVQGRHFGMTVFFLSQYFYSVPTDIRGNVDVVCLLNQTQEHQIEGICESYLNFLDEKVAVKLIQTVATERREIDNIYDPKYLESEVFVRLLIINVWTNKCNIKEALAWYAASGTPPEYKLMDQKYWRDNDMYSQTSSENGEYDFLETKF